MKCRCPSCGATFSLELLLTHEAARNAILSMFAISGEIGMAMMRYLSLHRPATRERLFFTPDRRTMTPALREFRLRNSHAEIEFSVKRTFSS